MLLSLICTPHYSLSSRHKELIPFNAPGRRRISVYRRGLEREWKRHLFNRYQRFFQHWWNYRGNLSHYVSRSPRQCLLHWQQYHSRLHWSGEPPSIKQLNDILPDLQPGTYGPEKKATCFQGEKQPPAYSIGGRSKYRRCKQSFITNLIPQVY